MDEYPYYIVPDIEALATATDPEELRRHRRRIAANIGDSDALRGVLGDATCDFHDFYGEMETPTLSTEDTIDSFLDKFGGEKEEIAAPAADYAAQLEAEMERSGMEMQVPADSTSGAIDAFLSSNPPQRIKPKKEPKEEEMPLLSESFAKILIKNGNYSRALEIITQISLNNPEKSIYFADQIRFLKKVILIQVTKS